MIAYSKFCFILSYFRHCSYYLIIFYCSKTQMGKTQVKQLKQSSPITYCITVMISFSYITDFSYFLVKKSSQSCRTCPEKVKNRPFERECRGFQLFYFLTRFIPGIAKHTIEHCSLQFVLLSCDLYYLLLLLTITRVDSKVRVSNIEEL